MQLEIKDDNTVISLVKDALSDKSTETKRDLQELASDCDNMDMTSITSTVNNINELDGIINQIEVKTGLAGSGFGAGITSDQDGE